MTFHSKRDPDTFYVSKTYADKCFYKIIKREKGWLKCDLN